MAFGGNAEPSCPSRWWRRPFVANVPVKLSVILAVVDSGKKNRKIHCPNTCGLNRNFCLTCSEFALQDRREDFFQTGGRPQFGVWQSVDLQQDAWTCIGNVFSTTDVLREACKPIRSNLLRSRRIENPENTRTGLKQI